MPDAYVPTTPTLALCMNLAQVVQAAWAPTAPDGVTWGAFTRYGGPDDPGTNLVGRQVEFFPDEEFEWETGTRGQDKYTHRVFAAVAERYPADTAGDVTRDWWAARVDFVHARIVQGLRYTRTGPAPFNPLLWTRGGRVQMTDLEKLISGNRLFFALVLLEFEEYVTPD